MPKNAWIQRRARGMVAGALLAAAAFLTASDARAQGELAANWLDCAPNGALNMIPSCQFNIGERRLMLSLAPAADVEQVVGWTLVVDFASNAATLPPWWQIQSGGCRAGQVTAAAPDGLEQGCVDVWSSTGSAIIQSYLYPRPGGDGRQLRMIIGVGVPSGSSFPLTAGQPYLAAVLSLRFGLTAPPGECAGCSEPVCLVFNSAEIVRNPGAPGPGPEPFVTPSPATGNQVTWGNGTACSTVPTRPRTWGQIKSLYR